MFVNSRMFCKIIDIFNVSIIFLTLFLSFISLNSQRDWTMFYSSMIQMRNKNNNIIDYISKTEQYFLNEIEHKDNIKNTSPEDLIYLENTREKEKKSFFSLIVKEITRGFEDGKYQRGY